MRVLLLVLLFLFISALVIISNGNLHMGDKIEVKKFINSYYSWLFNTGSNLFKTTAYVVKFEWLPNQNNTAVINSTK